MMPPKQPKIAQKLVLRTAIGLIALAGLIFAFQYLRGKKGDIADIGSVNSAGWIAAVEQLADGSQVVYIDKEGQVHRSPEHKPGSIEKEPLWRLDGNRIYFSSDKENSIYQIFRWNLANGAVENRAPSRVSRSNPEIDPFDPNSLLFIQSSLGYKLDVLAAKATRVFPPVEHSQEQKQQDDEAGPQGSGGFDFGVSERYQLTEAKWLDRKWLLGIQRLEDGEALIAQTTDLREDDTIQPFVVLVTGKKVMFDIVPETGEIFCAVAGFKLNRNEQVPPSFIQGTKVVMPFKYVLFKGTLEDYSKGFAELAQKHIMMASKKDDEAISNVVVSPDGKWVAVCRAEADPDLIVRPTSLVVYPVDPSAGQGIGLLQAPIYDPAWSPDSETIVFAMPEGAQDRLLYTVPRTGGTPARVSPEHGIFSTPKFSPQK